MIEITENSNCFDQLEALEKENFGGEAWNKLMLKQMFANPYCSSFAQLDSNGNIIAYCVLFCNDEFCEVCNIVVKKSLQGQHIGTRMLEHALLIASQRGIKKVLLEVNVNNPIAIGLYEKFGFKRIALRKNFYENSIFGSRDAYSMLKML